MVAETVSPVAVGDLERGRVVVDAVGRLLVGRRGDVVETLLRIKEQRATVQLGLHVGLHLLGVAGVELGVGQTLEAQAEVGAVQRLRTKDQVHHPAVGLVVLVERLHVAVELRHLVLGERLVDRGLSTQAAGLE